MSAGDIHITRDHDKGIETVERVIISDANGTVEINGRSVGTCRVTATTAESRDMTTGERLSPSEMFLRHKAGMTPAERAEFDRVTDTLRDEAKKMFEPPTTDADKG